MSTLSRVLFGMWVGCLAGYIIAFTATGAGFTAVGVVVSAAMVGYYWRREGGG